MAAAAVHTFPINVFPSVLAKTPDKRGRVSAAKLAEMMHQFREVTRKDEAQLITLVSYRESAASRGIADIELVHAVCGDIDGGFDQAKFDAGLDELRAAGAPVIAHETYSHTAQAPRWRVFVLLARPIPPNAYGACWRGLQAVFSGMLDDNAKDAGRLNYRPSRPPGQARQTITLNIDASGSLAGGALAVTEYLTARGQAEGAGLDASAVSQGVQQAFPLAPVSGAHGHPLNADVFGAPRPPDRARAVSALGVLSADCSRADWLAALWSARAAGAEFGDVLAWSEGGGDKFTGTDDVRKAWDSFDPARPGGVGAGTLFAMARQQGWQDPAITPPAHAAAGRVFAGGASAAGDALDEVEPTETKLAALLVRIPPQPLQFNHSRNQWMQYQGGAWLDCRKGEEIEWVKWFAARIQMHAARLLVSNPGGLNIKVMNACAALAQSARGVRAILELARSNPAVAVTDDEFDTDPDTFNAANCVVDLRTGQPIQHDPAQRLAKQSPVAFDPQAQCPQFLQFLDQVTCGDAALAEFLQRSMGYMLTGRVSEEVLFFWLGIGANGKSVLANIIRYIWGTYAVTVPPAFMMQRSAASAGGATPEVMMLAGARVGLANEIEAGARLSGATVKSAVSTEAVTGRVLYGNPVTFTPTHKLLVRANHRPIITDDDEGIWRRILLVPFALNLQPHQRDQGLEDRLRSEAPGILAWAAQGAAKWYATGLGVPPIVSDAVKAYRTESDLIGQWMTDRMELGSGYTVLQGRAFANYQQWCRDGGLPAMTKTSLTRELKRRGIGEGRESTGDRGRTYTGIRTNV